MSSANSVPGPLEVSIFVEGLRARAAFFLALALLVHAAIWTLAAWIADPTPHPKLAIALAQGREWQLGYADAPPLAPWILEIVYRLGGLFAVYALGPLTVALTGWLVFSFARRIVGDGHGAIAVFLMVGVHPVAFPVEPFDSYLLQMPLVAFAVLAWWRAIAERSRLFWIALGVALAALVYAGMTGLFVAAALAVMTAATAHGRAALRSYDAVVSAVAALFVFTLLITPRVIWLQHHELAGIVPASAGAGQLAVAVGSAVLAATVVLGHVGLMLLFAIGSPLRSPDHETAPVFMRPPLESFGRRVVIALAFLPLLLALATWTAAGVRLPTVAAAPLVLYSGLFVVMLAGQALRIHRQRAVAVAAMTLLFLPPVLDAANSLASPWVSNIGRATNWPAQAAAHYITGVYRTRTGRPLEIVVGNTVAASAVALMSPDRPRVFFDADPARAPWLDLDQVNSAGAVVLWPVLGVDASPPAHLVERLPPFVAEAPLALPWVRRGNLDRVRIGWAVLPPRG